MILDWPYNYHANNVCQQAAPIIIYKTKEKEKRANLFAVNKQIDMYLYLYPYRELILPDL